MKFWTAVIFSVYFIGCSNSIPDDEATPEERLMIQDILNETQELLLNLGIKKDLSLIPIIVSDNFNARASGACFKGRNNKGRAIVLKKNVLSGISSGLSSNRLWQTLMHEIGHCYFNRTHRAKFLIPETNFVFNFYLLNEYADKPRCHIQIMPYLNASVMNQERGFPLRYPLEIKIFYLKELVGLVKEPTLGNISGFLSIEHVPMDQSYEIEQPCYASYPPKMPLPEDFR